MRFQWDEAKNRLNRLKHGVSFETAAQVFFDANVVIEKDRIDEETGEQRWLALGLVAPQLLMVVHVYRSTNDENQEEVIRILSARKADRGQRRRYFE